MSFMVARNVITLTRGDTMRLDVSISDRNGNAYTPVEGDTITFGLSKSIDDEPLLLVDIPYDTMVLHIKPEDTKSLDYGTYYYDMQIQLANGDVYTFITYSEFKLTGEVVR